MRSFQKKVSLILPCYNEVEHIQVSLQKILAFLDFCLPQSDYEIILVDDFSTDGTRDWLKAFEHPNCRSLCHDKNLGRGAAVKTGIKNATGDIIGFMDIDCEVSEQYLMNFIKMIFEGNDLAIGNRIYRVNLNPYTIFRHLLSLGYK